MLEEKCSLFVLTPAPAHEVRGLLFKRDGFRQAAHRLKLKLDYSKIADHVASLREKAPLDDPDTVFVVDVTGVGQGVRSLLKERGMFFHEVTWTSGDSVKQHHDEYRVGKSYLMAQLGAVLSSSKLQIVEGLRDGKEVEKQLTDFQIEFTKAGNLTMNAAAGSHDDYVAALAMAWFGVQHCAGSLGPPREVVW